MKTGDLRFAHSMAALSGVDAGPYYRQRDLELHPRLGLTIVTATARGSEDETRHYAGVKMGDILASATLFPRTEALVYENDWTQARAVTVGRLALRTPCSDWLSISKDYFNVEVVDFDVPVKPDAEKIGPVFSESFRLLTTRALLATALYPFDGNTMDLVLSHDASQRARDTLEAIDIYTQAYSPARTLRQKHRLVTVRQALDSHFEESEHQLHIQPTKTTHQPATVISRVRQGYEAVLKNFNEN